MAAYESLVYYAGSGQYSDSFFQAIHDMMVNIRHVPYGLSLLREINRMGKKRWQIFDRPMTRRSLRTTKAASG